MGRLLKWTALGTGVGAALILLAVVVAGIWIRGRLSSSLPLLDGELSIAGLSQPVTIERDEAGVPTLRGATRSDIARATGFLHAQERFFQMDLLRRKAAGELAALVGPALVGEDRTVRVHRFRHLAARHFRRARGENRELLEAYAEGVNAGLETLGSSPPEYLVLRSDPAPWLAEDTTLVVLAMYLELQGDGGRRESALGLMLDLLPGPLVDFLAPRGSPWDAPLVGGPLPAPPPPAAERFDLRRQSPAAAAAGPHTAWLEQAPVAGSNGWAVAGAHTADGRAVLANDMHLGLSLPNIWYRARFVWPDEAGGEHRVTGITLPGTPPLIAGSNGRVAWGFTNSYGDWSDLVVLEPAGGDDELYVTPEGPRRIERIEERIEVKGAEDEILELYWTIWGPVIDRDHRGRRRVLRWVAHDLDAVNMGLVGMERARGLEQALDTAARTGIPTQNCVVADRQGRIAWTLMGPIPRRIGFDGRSPGSWADGSRRWDGYLAPGEYPRIVDPAGGRVWTANNRIVDGRALETIGDGGFASGARAGQIRDGLLALDRADERDMLAIQLDDRALFLERWRGLLLDTLTPAALAADSRRVELLRFVENGWTGRASVDSVAYRMVRAFRLFLAEQVFGAITAPCRAADDRFEFRRVGRWEGPLWGLVTERPRHLLDARFESWDDQLLAAVDQVLDRFLDEKNTTLETRTWGARNTVRIRHPISLAVPRLSAWLDIPPESLPGDAYMPRVQGIDFGASERMVVSPGREERGILHMPGGQSGHPMSPFYRNGHEAWARGEPTAFVPGPTRHRLVLLPAGAAPSIE